MDQSAVSLVRELYDAYRRRDLDGVLAGFAPDIQLRTMGRPADHPAFGERVGHEGFLDFLNTMADSHSFDLFEADAFYGSGDKVFVAGRVAVTFHRSGRSVENEFLHVWTVRDGKAVAYQEFMDTAAIVEGYRAQA